MAEGRASAGDTAQIRLIVEQVVEATIVKLGSVPAPVKMEKAEIPPILKTAGVIVSALLTMGVSALAFWLVTTLNEMQLTVARIDERLQAQVGDVDGRFAEVNRRIGRLEARTGKADQGEAE